MTLQITSMADIFTILLVFLLKSYSASATNIAPSAGMHLPQAVGQDQMVEALKVEISEDAVQVEGQPVATLEHFQFKADDLKDGGMLSKSLTAALERERKRQLMIAASNSDVKVDPKIIVVADHKVPYQTVKSVLASAATQGYTDFKLAVFKGD
jgi:biopolymer transport protein ExbD